MIIMKIKTIYFLLFLFVLPAIASAQKECEVTIDKDFRDFMWRDCCNVTGMDGTYSVELPDGRTVWIFGDSFLGTVNPDSTRDRRSPVFIRNSFAIQDGDSLRTLYQEIDGWESSLVIPPDATKGTTFSEDSLWYWPGDGFVENSKLKVFMSAFYQAHEGNWGFRWVRTDLAIFSLPEIKFEKIVKIPFAKSSKIHFGHAVADEDNNHTYIYGLGEDKYPYVARAPKGAVTDQWEFFTGKGWSTNVADIEPMIKRKGSEQFSVFLLNGKYIYLTQIGGFADNSIVSYTSNTPYGEWKNRQVLYKAHVPGNDKDLFAYNAVAHPQFLNKNGLLVSYNVNSFKLEDLFQDATIYRPRFIRVPIKMIFNDCGQ
jgi:hypothetical protein